MCWGHELRGTAVEGSGHGRKHLSGSSGCSENDSFRSKRAMVALFPAEVLHPRGLPGQGAALHSIALVHNRTFSSDASGAGHEVLMGVVGGRFGGGAGPFTSERKVVTVRPAVCCGSLVSGLVDCTQDFVPPVVGHPGSASCLQYRVVTDVVEPSRVPADPAHAIVLGSAEYPDEPVEGGERGASSKPRMPIQQERSCFRTCGYSNAPSLSGAPYASDAPLLSAWLPAPVQSLLPALPAAGQPLSVEGPLAANVGAPDAGVVAVSAGACSTPAECLTNEVDGTLKETASPVEEEEQSWQDAATSAGMSDEHVAQLCLLQYQAMMNDSSAVVDLGDWNSGMQGIQMQSNAHPSSACSGTGFVEQSGGGEEAQTSHLQEEGRQTTLQGCAEPGFPLGCCAGTDCFLERPVAGSVRAASASQSGLLSTQPAVEEEEGDEEYSHDEEDKLVATLLLQELAGQRDDEVHLPHDVARPTESSQGSSGEAMDGDREQYTDI